MVDLFSQLFTAENYPYVMFLTFYLAIIAILVVRWYRNRGKIKVRIHKPLEIESKLVAKEGNKLQIISGKGRRAEWAPTFTNGCLYQYPDNILWVIPRKSWAIDVKDQAQQCIDWSVDDPHPPSLNRDEVKAYSEAQALKAIGKGTKLELPLVFWFAVIGSMGSLILLLVIAQRMGIF